MSHWMLAHFNFNNVMLITSDFSKSMIQSNQIKSMTQSSQIKSNQILAHIFEMFDQPTLLQKLLASDDWSNLVFPAFCTFGDIATQLWDSFLTLLNIIFRFYDNIRMCKMCETNPIIERQFSNMRKHTWNHLQCPCDAYFIGIFQRFFNIPHKIKYSEFIEDDSWKYDKNTHKNLEYHISTHEISKNTFPHIKSRKSHFHIFGLKFSIKSMCHNVENWECGFFEYGVTIMFCSVYL